MKYCFTFLLLVALASCNTAKVKDRRLERDREQLVKELSAMVEKDQNGRIQLDKLRDDFGGTEVYAFKRDSLWTVQKTIDDANIERLIAITKKYGFPNVDRIKSPIPMWLIFQHTTPEYTERVRELITKEHKAGRFPNNEFKIINWHLGGRNGPLPEIN